MCQTFLKNYFAVKIHTVQEMLRPYLYICLVILNTFPKSDLIGNFLTILLPTKSNNLGLLMYRH